MSQLTKKAVVVSGENLNPNQLAERLALFNLDGSPFAGAGGGLEWAITGQSSADAQPNAPTETDIPIGSGYVGFAKSLPSSFAPGDLSFPSENGLFVVSATVSPWWDEALNPPVSGQVGAAIVLAQDENSADDLVRVTFATTPGTDGSLDTPGAGVTKFNIVGTGNPAGEIRIRTYQDAFADPISIPIDFAIVKLA
jgi:hypothetical protein